MTKPVGPYTPVMQAGGLIFVSGQVGLRDGALVDGFAAQAAQALTNLAGQLDSVGATMSDVVKTTVFLVQMSDYAEMNEIYIAAFGDHRPARSAVAVNELPIGEVFEVEAIAHVA